MQNTMLKHKTQSASHYVKYNVHALIFLLFKESFDEKRYYEKEIQKVYYTDYRLKKY